VVATALAAYATCIAGNLPIEDRMYFAEVMMSFAKFALDEEKV